MSSQQHRHVPGALKQTNKSFKTGSHSSKRSLARLQKGKVETVAPNKSPKAIDIDGKGKRKAQNLSQKKARRQEMQEERRIGAGGIEGPPKFVVGLALGVRVDVDMGLHNMLKKLGVEAPPTSFERPFTCRVTFGKQKQRFTVVNGGREMTPVLDAVKVADILLTYANADMGVATWGEELVQAVRHQGVPSVVGVLQGVDANRAKNEHRLARVKEYEQFLREDLHESVRALPGDSEDDLTAVGRYVFHTKLRTISWREKICFVTAQAVSYNAETSQLAVTGYVRNRALNPLRLAHIPGLGNFQVDKVMDGKDPWSKHVITKAVHEGAMEVEATTGDWTMSVPDPAKRDSLEEAFPADYMDNEQTWPTEEEMAAAGAKDKKPKKEKNPAPAKKEVPKGMSEYQAEWLLSGSDNESADYTDDDGVSGGEEMEYKDDMGAASDDENAAVPPPKNPAPLVDDGMEDDGMDLDEDLSPEDRAEQRRVALLEHRKEAEEDLEFNDEVDVPDDVAARIRFARYRGLKSFRSSPWDAKETLPEHYARIFQFENPERSRKVALRDTEGVEVGHYVTIYLAAVTPEDAKIAMDRRVLIVSMLLAHEQKFSVVHFSLKRTANTQEPIKSKEKMVFHFGFRRYEVAPVFSQNNMNCNKNKYERYLQPGRFSVASVIAPISHLSCPLLVFKGTGHSKAPTLVATGSLLKTDPDRLIIKRVVLTGIPFKIHKTKVTVRFMFHNPDDIRWFKPVELYTKHGRRGHILDALGTHGYMKCGFDGGVYHHDTVCMSLYKRIFPKWMTEVFKQ